MARAKKPDVAAELSAKMTQALEAERARGGGAYPAPLGRLRDLADPTAAQELVFKAANKRPLSERAVVAKKKSATAPVALREDLEQFVASRALLEFALERLYAAGAPPWSLKKVSGQLDKPLRTAFEAAVGRQAAEGRLPESVGVVHVSRKPALYLRRQPPPPPPPPPEVELADRLVRVLEAQRRLGPESYPVWLSRLVELAGSSLAPKMVAKARKREPFAGRVVSLAKSKTDVLVGLAEDAEEAVGSRAVLTFLLEVKRNKANQAFSIASLKIKVEKPVQAPFVASLTRQIEMDSLPAGVGCLTVSKKPLLFLLGDVRGRRPPALVREAPSPPPPPHVPAAPPAGFEAAFDEAFAQLDRQGGSYNFVSLVDLRQAVPFDRAAFDAQLRRLREAGRYTLSAAEGRHGITEEQRGAGISEDGTLLLFASRR